MPLGRRAEITTEEIVYIILVILFGIAIIYILTKKLFT